MSKGLIGYQVEHCLLTHEGGTKWYETIAVFCGVLGFDSASLFLWGPNGRVSSTNFQTHIGDCSKSRQVADKQISAKVKRGYVITERNIWPILDSRAQSVLRRFKHNDEATKWLCAINRSSHDGQLSAIEPVIVGKPKQNPLELVEGFGEW